ncbi:MAG TPA: RiPP maturation radical SAM C-methyltransferase, partial [Thermoanaerobaculia bacterium]
MEAIIAVRETRPETTSAFRRDGAAPLPSATPVVLVVPPVINPLFPTLGAALLAPACRRQGVEARVHYANIAFARRVGVRLCLQLTAGRPYTMPGEAIFWGGAFPERAADHARVLEALARLEEPTQQIRRLPPPTIDEIRFCVEEIPGFLEETADNLLASSPRIVGISSMCQQTMASIAIARAIKRRRPDVLTVLGGVNAAEPLGSALLELTDAFDYVFSGEADEAFPAFCRAYLERGELPNQRVVRCASIGDLDSVPMPDYRDYYEQFEPLRTSDPFASRGPARLIFESSRGCWWGDKHHCAFCGFNALGGRYRSKSPDRILAEIEALRADYGIHEIFAADTIMAHDLPSTVLPRLSGQGADCSLSYVVKSNVREIDLDAFASAGVLEIQPGIESFSSHVL